MNNPIILQSFHSGDEPAEITVSTNRAGQIVVQLGEQLHQVELYLSDVDAAKIASGIVQKITEKWLCND